MSSHFNPSMPTFGWFFPISLTLQQSVTDILPFVIVPVLSNAIEFTSDRYCKAAPFLNNIPWLAATPVATKTAVGVARPKAHGHALTQTDNPLENAKKKKALLAELSSQSGLPESTWIRSSGIAPKCNASSYIVKVAIEIIDTMGTNNLSHENSWSMFYGHKWRKKDKKWIVIINLAIKSAISWTGGLDAWASCTVATILPRVLSSPVADTNK